MSRLALGLLLWSLVHLFPALAPAAKGRLISRYGENSYKGIFGLLIILSLYLTISGWMSLTPVEPDVLAEVYTPAEWTVYPAGLMVLIGFVLFMAPYPPNNFKRLLRHPQLLGVACWAVGHLLAAGTARAILLFGVLTVWALLEILAINRREGPWQRPEKAPFKNDLALVVFSVLAYMAFLFTHHLIFGGSALT